MASGAETYDVIVVGGGNAALCAALSAHDEGARVLVLERAPVAERGGNTAYTDGLMRVVYEGADDIRAFAPDLTDAEVAVSDFGVIYAGAQKNRTRKLPFLEPLGARLEPDPDTCGNFSLPQGLAPAGDWSNGVVVVV